MTKLWRPSNGTCGEIFRFDWCDKCSRESAVTQCKILTQTLIYDIDDEDYPKEWIADDDGWSNPRCTAFKARAGAAHRPRRIRDKRQANLLLPSGASKTG
jgi:hypothetical protein